MRQGSQSKIVVLLIAALLGMCIATNAMAQTEFTTSFTPACGNIYFAVNDAGTQPPLSSFWVESSPIVASATPPGVLAQSYIVGSNFHLNATNPAGGVGYSDAAIVLFFNCGGIKLGDLVSISVNGISTPANRIAVNLWLDTGGDGKFFAFAANGNFTGLNGDSYYGTTPGTSVDASTSFYCLAGLCPAGNITLAQLQSGTVPGITADTPLALWIGITDSPTNATADISSVTVTTRNPLPIGCACPAPAKVSTVPTMNEWGMIIFLVLAGLGSLYFIRRQRKSEN